MKEEAKHEGRHVRRVAVMIGWKI